MYYHEFSSFISSVSFFFAGNDSINNFSKMDNIMKRTNEKKFGHEFPAVMALREARITAKDSGGYSEGEKVFFVVPDPEEVAGSTEPTKDTAEVEDTKSNGQSSTPAAAVLPETTSTNT